MQRAWIILSLLSFLGTQFIQGQSNEDCMMCHADPELTLEIDGRSVSLYVRDGLLESSVHSALQCIQCHTDARGVEFPHEPLKPVNCATCHGREVEGYNTGVHGQAKSLNNPNAPDCIECHGNHNILSARNPKSLTYSMSISGLCGKCHVEGEAVFRRYPVTGSGKTASYSQNIHGKSLIGKGLSVSATCSDCHGAHLILPGNSPNSSVSYGKISITCTRCHTDAGGIHRETVGTSPLPACTTCHQPHQGATTATGGSVSDQSCEECHGVESFIRESDGKSLYVSRNTLSASVHKKITCTACHQGADPAANPPCHNLEAVDCASCHSSTAELYNDSGHGKAHESGVANAPYCIDCHGTHDIRSRYDDTSPVYRTQIPALCGKCHLEGGKAPLTTHLKEVNAFTDYSQSVHGKGLTEKGLLVTAVCTDCHTTHDIKKETDPTSSIHPDHLPQTCARCHKGIYDQYIKSDHAKGLGKEEYPTCVTCHSAHTITDIENDAFLKEVSLQCGTCHTNVAATYFETYHGKAYLLGKLDAAKCSDCHGAHDILKRENPDSKISEKRLVSTCQQCHPSAGEKFTGYLTHATHNDKENYPQLFYVYLFMTILLLSVFGFFGTHLIMWLPRSLQEIIRKRKQKKATKTTGVYIRRFNLAQRLTHLAVIISFLILVATGMMLKFAGAHWATVFASLIGGVEVAGILHRFGAIITFGYFGYHLYSLIVHKIRNKITWKELIFGKNALMFNKQDIKDLGAMIRWFFGKGQKPAFGRWTYWEKFDYFAVFWGVAVIGLSGLVMWFPEFSTRYLPGWIINVAQIIHSDEALLAAGFIFTIHFFNTHLRPESFPLDQVIFTGIAPLDHYREERAKEVEELEKSGKLEEMIVEQDVSSGTRKIVRFFGFLFLGTGLILVGLIIYSLLTH